MSDPLTHAMHELGELETREREQCYWDARDRGLPTPIPASILIKAGKGIDMTCRFELEFKGQQYPRSCPTCGLGGKCHKGYAQIKKEGGGYELVDEQGVNASGARIGMDGLPYKLHEGLTIPPPQPERTGYMNDPPKPEEAPPTVKRISLHRKLKLMMYLSDTFKIDSMLTLEQTVKDIEHIISD